MQRLRDDAGVACLQLYRELLNDVMNVPLGDFGAVREELSRLAGHTSRGETRHHREPTLRDLLGLHVLDVLHARDGLYEGVEPDSQI